MKDDQQRSNFVRISNYYKVQFPFPKVSALMYLALNSLHVDERIAFLQVRRADRVQHIGQHIILLGWTTKFCSFPYIILSLLLLLPISLVLSYGCDNVENAASDYSYFFLLQHITAHIADYKKSRARSSTLYRKLFELRESQIFLKQIVLFHLPSWALYQQPIVECKVECAALSIHDGCVMSWAACIHRAKWRGMKRETTRRDTHLSQLFDPETISSIPTFATLHRVFWFPAQPSTAHSIECWLIYTQIRQYNIVRNKQTRWSPYIVLYSAASLSLSLFLVSYRRLLNGGISDKITRKTLETAPCLFYFLYITRSISVRHQHQI